jgi:hypothetical protein
MRHVDAETLVNAVPIAMTRREKLLKLAELVRHHDPELALFHGIEYMTSCDMRSIRPGRGLATSAFALAVKDPTFNAQGLSVESTMIDVVKFFELSRDELHEFSCDCGGYITNYNQAARIERLAG